MASSSVRKFAVRMYTSRKKKKTNKQNKERWSFAHCAVLVYNPVSVSISRLYKLHVEHCLKREELVQKFNQGNFTIIWRFWSLASPLRNHAKSISLCGLYVIIWGLTKYIWILAASFTTIAENVLEGPYLCSPLTYTDSQ